MSLRDKILNLVDLRERRVKVEAWGCELIVRELTGAQRVELNAIYKDSPNPLDFTLGLIVLSVWDPKTKARMFTVEDIPALKNKAGTVIDLLGDVCLELNGLRVEDREAAAKNS